MKLVHTCSLGFDTRGILWGESYNGIHALNTQQAFWCHCLGMVAVWVNWKYAITIFKEWRFAINYHPIGNLTLQFNHTLKVAIAIRSDIGNFPFKFDIWLNCNVIYPISWIVMAYLKTAKVVMAYFQLTIVVSIFVHNGPCIFCFSLFLPLPPLPMERSSFHDLSASTYEFNDLSTFTSDHELHFHIMSMVRYRPFFGAINEKFKELYSRLVLLGMTHESIR
jgi:hypothetical protein